jgi:hypothetical protein
MIRSRSYWPCLFAEPKGRPVFEPPAVVINPKLAINYWDAWLGIFFICSMTWSRL